MSPFDFLESLREYLNECLTIDEKMRVFDIEERRAKNVCLSTAVDLEETALNLVFFGLDDRALEYYSTIEQLAIAGYEDNEGSYYDIDGKNHFGRYMAMRVAATCRWVLGNDRAILFNKMIHHLEEAIDLDLDQSPDSSLAPEAAGRYFMHLAQGELWRNATNFLNTHSVTPATKTPWSKLTELLSDLARSNPPGSPSETLKKDFDKWFLRRVDLDRHESGYDESFTANDIISIAEIRARFFYGIHDPLLTMRSILWPDFNFPSH